MRTCLMASLVACLVVISSCSEPTGPKLPNGLTQREFDAMVELILGGSAESSANVTTTKTAYQIATFNLDPIDEWMPNSVRQCDGAGTFVKTFHVVGNWNRVTNISIVDWTETYSFTNCKMEEDDIPFVFDGNPGMIGLHHDEVQCKPDNTCIYLIPSISHMTGNIKAKLEDGRSITCAVDIARTTPTWPGKPGVGTYKGTFCGEPVDEPFDYGPIAGTRYLPGR
jgi:hypothetical protein